VQKIRAHACEARCFIWYA